MPTIKIIFLDRKDQPTTDRVTGTPNVYATVAIDGMEVMSGQPAVVVRPADKSKIRHPYLRDAHEDVYEGTITIHGLDEPVQTYFIARNHRPRILIGRHVLERYHMIYNPLGGVFSLEKKSRPRGS